MKKQIVFYISKDEKHFGWRNKTFTDWQEGDDIVCDGRSCYIFAIEDYNHIFIDYINYLVEGLELVADKRACSSSDKTPADIFCEAVEEYCDCVAQNNIGSLRVLITDYLESLRKVKNNTYERIVQDVFQMLNKEELSWIAR